MDERPADRPRRTCLYLPAANARAVEKSRSLNADVVMLDLEDSVAPEAKEAAREAAVAAVAGDFGLREVGIRVNGLGTSWSEADFAAVAASKADFIIVPKVNTADEAREAVRLAGGKPVWAMIETPRAVLQAEQIAHVPGVTALVAGFADLTKDLRARSTPDRLPLLFAASRLLLAARDAGILAFDGVFTAIGDEEGLIAEAEQGLQLGFDGKTCIHPSQLTLVNRVFTPTDAEITEAKGMIAAHEAAAAEGRGVATYRGKMVESLHVLEARRLLDIAEAIAKLDAA